MSTDYPDREVWLAKRRTPRGMIHVHRMHPVESGGQSRDPGRTHAHRRLKGPLLIATGAGSMDAESEMQGLVWAGRQDDAAALYEACQRIHYKHGKPKMHWGDIWYAAYKAGRTVV